MSLDLILFYALAGVAVLSAIVMIAQRNAILSAFSLIVTLGALAGIFGLLGSPFIAALQVIVYAGAIMVLFLFVLMLLAVGREEQAPRPKALLFTAGALSALLAAELGWAIGRVVRAPAPFFDASTKTMALTLFSAPFLYPFIATSILITVALVGAVVLSKRDEP